VTLPLTRRPDYRRPGRPHVGRFAGDLGVRAQRPGIDPARSVLVISSRLLSPQAVGHAPAFRSRRRAVRAGRLCPGRRPASYLP
jgi:hypothetical protein